MSYDLSIIIVNWNGSGLLTRCVETIASSAPNLTYEIVVVDNASQDDSIGQLRSNEVAAQMFAKEQLRIVNNADNRGFGAANNQAFALTDSPFVFLLNLDTEVRPGTIDTLIDRLRSDPTIGACGPKILNVDGSLQTSVFFNPPCVWHTVLSQLWLYRLLPQRIRGELLLGWHFKHDRERFVPMLGAAALMTRREMLDEVGGFNEKFHMYAEDNEWCWRITQSNWRLKFVPDAVVLHHGATSSSKRWSPTEQIRVKLRAEFEFEHQVMPRWRLAANQFANYMVATLQLTGRKLVGIQRPELQVIKEMHGEHLRRSLRI